MTVETLSEHGCFGGVQGYYRHESREIGLPMRFSVYQPPQVRTAAAPVLLCLAGLTCTEETFMIKAGAQRVAAELGMILVTCDTSPRNTGIEGENAEWDFGTAAGFYLDATQPPWNRHFRMESYIVDELLGVVHEHFNTREDRIGILGHSMGGHGALTLALRHPGRFTSVSALAPIAAPSQCPWGEKAFGRYLGDDRAVWAEHDASALMAARHRPFAQGILVDQGESDLFLPTQLLPHKLVEACALAQQPLTLRRHPGYDHGYYFIASFIEDHLRFHHAALSA